ncbi:unnamed protein product [Adineta steineri]|uniref:OCIA domain-containing protein n=1 Tax=Adineta steineri TaxID=433720 RepID=A0A813XFS5_9BILA|nr:unnamed protein product [Adineta steineri]CAF0728115.1 unnamed protein product [Adineta steineri]CAF0753658.1 unnamed protein product [Adineta steineri]CAF0827207.1 unnamed protein product [Adineta steineri]CAF0833715.1 unnamed protein product [Adineta steineri]
MSQNNTTQAHPQMPPTQLNQEEKRVLAECEKESLMYRSIPLGLMTFFATQYAMSRNMITTKGKWLKLSTSLFAGYILGKISYAPTCRNKILTQIPESNLAHAIRGVEVVQAGANPDEHNNQRFISKPSRDPSEAVVFLPDPVDPDTHTVPVGVNQYGDPIYHTTK